MKFLATILLILGCTLPMLGQTAIAIDRESTLYHGIENAITVVSRDCKKEALAVTVDSGTVSGSDGHYTLTFSQPGRIAVHVNNKTSHKKLYTQYFQVKPLPKATGYLLNRTGGTISAKEIRQAIAPLAVLPGFGFDLKIIIDGFALIVVRNEQVIFYKYIKQSSRGARFSDEPSAEKMIKSLQAGDKIKLTDIYTIYPASSHNSFIAPMEFTITE